MTSLIIPLINTLVQYNTEVSNHIPASQILRDHNLWPADLLQNLCKSILKLFDQK